MRPVSKLTLKKSKPEDKKIKVVKLRKEFIGDAQEIDGRPCSASIMAGDSYKLRRDRADLYKRIKKTVNIDYDPK